MKVAIYLFGAMLLSSAVKAQEYAPTVESCRADRLLWFGSEADRTDYLSQQTKEIKDGTRNTNVFAKLSLREVLKRSQEMGACDAVDNQNGGLYFQAQTFYTGIQADRVSGFLKRHNLYGQLLTEDDDGLR